MDADHPQNGALFHVGSQRVRAKDRIAGSIVAKRAHFMQCTPMRIARR